MTEPGPPFLSAQNPAKLRQGRKEALPCHALFPSAVQDGFRNSDPGLHGKPGLPCSQPGMLPIRPGLSVAEDAHKRERGPCMTGQNSPNP